MANQVDFKILPSDQFNVYSPQTRSDKVITYFTLLSKLRGDILTVGQDEDPNDIVSAYYSNVGGTQTLHLVKADGSEITASQPEQVISGTLNYVSKFTSANDIGDSQIFDDGTNVGIGTTSMTHKLQLGTGGVFADYYQLDTTYSNGFVVGAISWDSDNGTADIGLSGSLKLKVGQDDMWYVKNQTGSPITKGTAVYASGTLGASGRILVSPMIANGTIPARFFLGIVAETIANGADGYVMNKGKIRQINTNAYNEGDVLWVSPTTAGALTATEPTAPSLKLAVAFVVHKNTNGVIAVRSTTGVRIADASDVEYSGAADNSFLVYNSSTGVWEDENIGIFKTIAVSGQSSVVADAYDDTLTLVAGTNVTITTNASTDTITINATDQYVGTVTSVDMSVPTGFAISGNPITTSGTLALAFAAGYSLPTNATQANWTTAYNDSITAFSYNTSTGVLTLTQQDAGTLTATVTLQPFTTDNLTQGSTNLYDKIVSLTGAGTTVVTGTYPNFTITSNDQHVGTVTSIATTAPITGGTITSTGTIGITQSGAASDGYLSSTDWNTFNSKEPALTKGNLTEATSSVLTINGGTNAVIGTGTTIQVSQASSTTSGYLSSTDWTTFNGKASNSFTTIAVATQSSIVADSATDTLTIAAGTGVTITTDATTDTLTISATGSGGTVTSVDLTAGTGISVSGGPITTSGSITVTNTAPDQTVVLTAGTGISTSGTYPNFTITNSAPDQTVVLTAGTGITTSGTYPNFTVTNAAPDQTVALTAGTGISVTGTYPNFTITNSSPSSGGTVTSIATTAPITGGTITSTGTIGITQSGAAADGYLSSTDWNTFNSKQNAITLTTTGNSGSATFVSSTLNIPTYTLAGLGGVPTTRTITINGTAQDLSADRTWSVGTVTSISLTAGDRIEISGGPITSSGSITVTHGTATGADFTTAEAFRDRVIADGGTFEALGEVAIAIGSLEDAASPTSTDYSDGVVLQNLAVDEFGHVLGVGATDLDDRYLQSITAGTGISVSGSPSSTDGVVTITNSDTGSAQNIFKNIAVSGQSTIVADSNNDTLTLSAGTGISLTTNAGTDTLTITNTASTDIKVFAAYSTDNLSLTTSGNEYACEFNVQSIVDTSVFSHSTTTNPNLIEVLSSGRYEVSFGYMASNGNNQIVTLLATLAINGVGQYFPFSFMQLNTATNGQYVSSSVNTYIYELSANDEIEVYFSPTYVGGSTGSITVNPSGYDGSTYITIKKIG